MFSLLCILLDLCSSTPYPRALQPSPVSGRHSVLLFPSPLHLESLSALELNLFSRTQLRWYMRETWGPTQWTFCLCFHHFSLSLFNGYHLIFKQFVVSLLHKVRNFVLLNSEPMSVCWIIFVELILDSFFSPSSCCHICSGWLWQTTVTERGL